MALLITRVSITPNNRTTDATVIQFWYFQHKEKNLILLATLPAAV